MFDEVSTAQVINVLVQVGIPMLISLVTKKSTSTRVKWILLSVLTGVNTALLAYAPGQTLESLGLSTVLGIIVSLGAHHGVYVPAGVTQKLQETLVKDKVVEEPAVLDPAEEVQHVDLELAVLTEESVQEGSAESLPQDLEFEGVPQCTVRHREGSSAQMRCLADPFSCPGRQQLVP